VSHSQEQPSAAPEPTSGLRAWRVPALLTLIVAAAAALRFYGLGWGAPYSHFHIDEHFVFVGAYFLRRSMQEAAESTKFFMYGPLPMHLLNGVLWLYQRVEPALDLTVFKDQVTYMVMGRAISASMGTATVLAVFFIARRLANATAGLVAAMLLATTVIHISESHSFRVDLTMIFFVSLAWFYSLRIAERGAWSDYLMAGLMAGAAIASKYNAVFIVGVIGLAHLLSVRRPAAWSDRAGWLAWTVRGLSPLAVIAAVFAVASPMAFIYRNKFWRDINEQIIGPVLAGETPFFVSQFADLKHPTLYWFTTNFWWGFGPALEIWGLLGIIWFFVRPSRLTMVAASFPLFYFLIAGGTSAPMARYILPLSPAFAVAAGVLSASLLRQPRFRTAAVAVTAVVIAATAFYGVAYASIYTPPDARLAASRYLVTNVPRGSHILVEPAHSTPPTGTYLQNPQFLGDYVLWDTQEQSDYYMLYSLDTYHFLFRTDISADAKRNYISDRVGLADYIVMDDFYLQMYQHLPEAQHAAVKDYYRQLFDGELGFDLIQTFKHYPKLFGITINDDGAELSSRMNDHPRIYIFKRRERR
jgi:4-amino-4-deoxy-L-arabinose transferase-like glycosyltransferase